MKIRVPWSLGTGNIIIETSTENKLELKTTPTPMPGYGNNQTFIAVNSVVFLTNHALSISSDSLTNVQRQQTLTFQTELGKGTPQVTRTLTVIQQAATLPTYIINIKDLNTVTPSQVEAFDFETANIQPSEIIQFGKSTRSTIDLSGYEVSLYNKYNEVLATLESTSTGILTFSSVEALGPYGIKISKGNEEYYYKNVVFNANNEFNIYINFTGSEDF